MRLKRFAQHLNYINNLHADSKQDTELWLEMIGGIKFGLEIAQNPIFVFYDLGSKQDTVVFDKTGKILNLDYSTQNLIKWPLVGLFNFAIFT